MIVLHYAHIFYMSLHVAPGKIPHIVIVIYCSEFMMYRYLVHWPIHYQVSHMNLVFPLFFIDIDSTKKVHIQTISGRQTIACLDLLANIGFLLLFVMIFLCCARVMSVVELQELRTRSFFVHALNFTALSFENQHYFAVIVFHTPLYSDFILQTSH